MIGAQRAATLTRRLLAFSRRQPLDPKPIDVNRLVDGLADFFQRSLPPDIELQVCCASYVWLTEADPTELESAILNPRDKCSPRAWCWRRADYQNKQSPDRART